MSERSNNGLSRPAQFPMVLVAFLATGIGLIASGIAFVLYKLIGLFTNIFFYHHFAPTSSARDITSSACG